MTLAFTNIIRRLVSGKKRRYAQEGFDLDLVYIDCGPTFKRRLIAMGYPASGLEGVYRNNVVEVRRFLESQAAQHGGTYKVYNLTEEKPHYTSEKLGGSVAKYPYADHQVPTLAMLWEFCKDLDAFLGEDDRNFAAVHCKAGKGRTGVMICAYLLYKGLASNAEDAMRIYGEQRSQNSLGLTVESQRRWVRYFEASLKEGTVPQAHYLSLQSINVAGLPSRQLKNLVISIDTRDLESGDVQHIARIAGNQADVPTKSSIARDKLGIEFTPLPSGSSSSGEMDELKVDGDVRIEVYSRKVSQRSLVCRTWLSTAYLSPGPLMLESHQLDKGAGPVPKDLILQPTFGEAHRSSLSCAFSASPSELESLPLGSPPAHQTQISSRNLTPLRTSQEVSRTVSDPSVASTPHILDIHPDFSIPARYFTSPCTGSSQMTASDSTMSIVPPLDTNRHHRNPFLAAVQESFTPLDSERSFRVDQQELSARLEHLAEIQSKDSGVRDSLEEVSPFLNADISLDMQYPVDLADQNSNSRRSGSWPRGTALKKAVTSNFKRVRWPAQWQDPELQDWSAPTTPSRPRHPGSLDWQSTPPYLSLSSSLINLENDMSVNTVMQRDGSSAALEWGSGVDTPSHAAQLIKWMSSSWWLTMA